MPRRSVRAFQLWRMATVGVFAATVMLTGCASIPNSGSVHSAEQAAGAESGTQPQQDVQAYPKPPADGANAEEIVRGFLDASGAVEPAVAGQPDFATARKYLAFDDPKRWQPGNEIKIYDGSPKWDSHGSETAHSTVRVDFDAALTGTIDSRGTYSPALPGKRHTWHFDVAEVKGQRRIETLPAQLLISKSNFDREFESLDLYFYDPSWKFLVPDPIYLAKRADRATLLVRGLLQGPSLWLSSAANSAVPEGVALTPRGVRVVGGQAFVDLTRPAGQADRAQFDRIAQQLARTLAQLQVSSVTVTVEGKASPITDFEVDKVVSEPPESDVYGLRDNLLHVVPSIGADEEKPVRMAGKFGSSLKLSDFAVQPGSTSGNTATVAGIDQKRTRLYIARGVLEPVRVLNGERLKSPTWDRAGRLWVIDQRRGGSWIHVIDEHLVLDRGQPPLAITPHDVGRPVTVEAIAVSEDGTRLALVTRDSRGRRQARIATVSWEGSSGVVLTPPRSLAPGLRAIDVAWRGPAELVILGEQNGQVQPYLVSVDGSQLAPQGFIEKPKSVAAARNRPILIGTESNELWQQSGGGSWERFDPNLATPHYPG